MGGVLSALEPDPRVARVEIRGRTVEVRPLTVEAMPPFLRAGSAAFAAIFASETYAPLLDAAAGAEARTTAIAGLMQDHQPALVAAVAVALGEDEGVVGKLNYSEFIALLAKVLEVNLDFFTQAIRPALGRLFLAVGAIRSRSQFNELSAPRPGSSSSGTGTQKH